MDIGVPKEKRPYEFRVGLTPLTVKTLTELGHRVYIETEAGQSAGFSNHEYEKSGGIIVYDKEEIYGRPDLLVKISRPMYEELQLMKEKIIIIGFLQLHATKMDKIELIQTKKMTTLSSELIKIDNDFPILGAISTLAGQILPYVAFLHLNNLHDGPGIILGGAPGIPSAEVVVIGCGNAGFEVARNFVNIGAQVTVLDRNPRKLKEILRVMGNSRLVTMMSNKHTISKVVKYADVVVLAVQIPGQRAPILLTEEMVKTMKPRSIIIDLSIDQGGASETSRLTHHGAPTFVKHGVIHYCVPNLSSIAARSASYAYNNALMPILCRLVNLKDISKIKTDPVLKTGLVTYQGAIIHPSLQQRVKTSSLKTKEA